MLIIKCKQCKIEKQESEYNSFRGRLNKSCKECRIKNNSWYAQDKDLRKTKAKIRYQKIKNQIAQYRSDLRLEREYSLSRQEWNTMLVKQKNQCGICNVEFGKIKPCVDHNHTTGKVRGLLCRRCNLELQVVENEDFVLRSQIYLKSMT
jgi:hypothetical protein